MSSSNMLPVKGASSGIRLISKSTVPCKVLGATVRGTGDRIWVRSQWVRSQWRTDLGTVTVALAELHGVLRGVLYDELFGELARGGIP
mmetsp:Transcript_86596/g.210011  ORF Transcript_86596/g.210011 Transcript_86596/m.210011 type:complete len:88 (-) Transcript_86596:120-383(-)